MESTYFSAQQVIGLHSIVNSLKIDVDINHNTYLIPQ